MPLLPTLLLLAVLAPGADRTSWMSPESFHLELGIPQQTALEALRPWNPKRGADDQEIVVDYDAQKAMTLTFRNARLVSIRFELFTLLPDSRKAFEEARAMLLASRGKPRTSGKSVIVYDAAVPNIIAVVSADPASEQGKKGIGVVVVRYFQP